MQARSSLDPGDLVELLTDVVYALDLRGRFTYVNPAGVALLGRHQNELLGAHFLTIVDESSADAALGLYRLGLSEQATSPYFEVRVRRSDGEVRELEIHAGTCIRDGRVVGRQGVGRDITELRRLRAELADKSGRLALIEEQQLNAVHIYRRLSSLAASLTERPDQIGHALDSLERSVRDARARALGLDETDLQISRLIAEGWSNGDIASQVHLSVHTVKDRAARIVERLGARSRAGVGLKATEAGIVP